MSTAEKLIGKFLVLKILKAENLADKAGYVVTVTGFAEPLEISYEEAVKLANSQNGAF